MDISKFGKGALVTPDAVKAKQFILGVVPSSVDWSKPFVVESGFTLPQRNQDGSSSCTAQATSYYSEALEFLKNGKLEQYSARFIYSQIYLPGGGAYIADAMKIPLPTSSNPPSYISGLASLDSVPEGDSSEAIMTDRSLNSKGVIEARADKFAIIPNSRDIDFLASVIQQYSGFITGFKGSNDMFDADGTFRIPTNPTWGHAVFACGFEIRNGVKCIRIKNSWGNWGTNGYGFIPIDFVENGPMFDLYTYAQLNDIINNVLMNDTQLNNLWLAVFKRPIDSQGLDFYRGKSFDVVIADVLNSAENKEYTPIFQAIKSLENDIRSGKF